MATNLDHPAAWFDQIISLSFPNSNAYDVGDLPKRHTACDECRHRKLKCSGEAIGCSRCLKQSLHCHYSLQKQMGRPPKRKRADGAQDGSSTMTQDDSAVADLLPVLDSIPDPVGALEASNMCPSIYKSFMKNQYNLKAGPFVTNGPIFEPETSLQEPIAEWIPENPDYSQINTSMLFQSSLDSTFPQVTPPTMASCSCLSYLYLCLSSISTLSSFPLSVHTLTTLYNAARTAKAVIFCEVCPRAFNTSMQNLMLLGTLLNVVADAWLVVSGKDPEALGTVSVDPSHLSLLPNDSELRREHWDKWLRNVIKHAVVGSSVPPIVQAVQSQCMSTPSLLSLVEDLEERQRRRHEDLKAGREPMDALVKSSILSKSYYKEDDEHDYFCLRVIGSVRKVIARFNFGDECQPTTVI